MLPAPENSFHAESLATLGETICLHRNGFTIFLMGKTPMSSAPITSVAIVPLFRACDIR